MTPQYRIRKGFGFCRFDDRTIILDVAADRYWQVGAAAGAFLEQIARGRPPTGDEAELDRLCRLGCLETEAKNDARSRGNQSERAELPQPSSSAIETGFTMQRASWIAAGEILLLLIAARVGLRMFPLKAILDRLAAQKQWAPSEAARADLASLAIRFHQHRRLLPVKVRCLPDSIAFLWFVKRRGYFPRLVFGVEAYPFSAHCWVQDGATVLTDALDHATLFKRIMVV